MGKPVLIRWYIRVPNYVKERLAINTNSHSFATLQQHIVKVRTKEANSHSLGQPGGNRTLCIFRDEPLGSADD